jgi:hypothetical protein
MRPSTIYARSFNGCYETIAERDHTLNQDVRISCQYRNSAKTEDIWLKSALEGKSGASWITENNLLKREVRAFPVNLHSKIIQKAECCREKFEKKKLGDVGGRKGKELSG